MKRYLYILLVLSIVACKHNQSAIDIKALSIDLSDYYHPSGDEVELFTKQRIISREDAVELGDLLYHKPTSVSRVSCADCHDLHFGGRSQNNKEHGGGLFRSKYADSYERVNGERPSIPIDSKPFKNITTLNSYRVHASGKILHHGAVSDFPLEAQVDSATKAHFMEDLVIECRHDAHLQKLAINGFGRYLNSHVVKSAVSAFEQTLTTSETNASMGVITNLSGFELFDEHCKDCHFNRVKSASLALDPIHTEVIPQSLENIRQSAGYFQTSEDISLNDAIKRHGGVHVGAEALTWANIRSIKNFMINDLTDRRYINFKN